MKKRFCFLLISALPLTLAASLDLTMPSLSDTRLSFHGDPASGFGIVGFRNAQLGQPDTGHLVSGVIQNAPNPAVNPEYKLYADYYIAGLNHSPFSNKPVNATAAAQAGTPHNMASTANYVASNSLSYGNIHFHFGPSSAEPFHATWNLGNDTQDADWSGTLASPIEQRIYTANPATSSAYLAYNGTAILSFGSSPLFEIINYGATQLTNDDSIQAYSNPVTAEKVAGLDPLHEGLADAFLADVTAGGGLVQLYFDTIQPVSYLDSPEIVDAKAYLAFNYEFSGAVQVVPEPSIYAVVCGLAVLPLIVIRRRRKV